MTFGIDGQADITGILKNGRRLEVEIKTGNAKQSEEQILFQKMIEANNGLYIIVCNDCAQLVQALENNSSANLLS